MPSATIPVCKFVGTISLGLLTGISTALSTLTLPSLLTLRTAATAQTTLAYLRTKTYHLTTYLRHATSLSLFAAYVLSPRRARHPYLLYTALLAFLSGSGVDYGLALRGMGDEEVPAQADVRGEEDQDEEVNGEQVRRVVERTRVVEGVRAGVAGLGFAMGVIGIWGDGA